MHQQLQDVLHHTEDRLAWTNVIKKHTILKVTIRRTKDTIIKKDIKISLSQMSKVTYDNIFDFLLLQLQTLKLIIIIKKNYKRVTDRISATSSEYPTTLFKNNATPKVVSTGVVRATEYSFALQRGRNTLESPLFSRTIEIDVKGRSKGNSISKSDVIITHEKCSLGFQLHVE